MKTLFPISMTALVLSNATAVAQLTTLPDVLTVNDAQVCSSRPQEAPMALSFEIKRPQPAIKGIAVPARRIPETRNTPYSSTFSDESCLQDFAAYDANGDEYTWFWDNSYGRMLIYFNFDFVTPMDDWLYMPPFNLKKDCYYEIIFWANRDPQYAVTERMEVKAGLSPDPEDMNITLLEPFDITESVTTQYACSFVPSEDGVYWIGFHGISEPAQYVLYLDNVSISAGSPPEAPARVSDLEIAPNIDGLSKCEVNFTAPSTDMAGNPVSKLTNLVLSRDGYVEQTITEPIAGQKYSFTVNSSVGYHSYELYTENEYGISPIARAKAYTGINKPLAPAAVYIEDTGDGGEVKISWDAVDTDVDGHPLKAENVSYDVYLKNTAGTNVAIRNNIKDQHCTIDNIVAEKQQMVYAVVYARTIKSNSEESPASIKLPMGPSYDMPYHESVSGKVPHSVLGSNTITGTAQWFFSYDREISALLSADVDNGFMLMYVNNSGDQAELVTGRVKIAGDNPVLSFHYMPLPTGSPDKQNQNTIDVYAYLPDGSKLLLSSVSQNAPYGTPINQWKRTSIDLSSLKDMDVYFSFLGTCLNANIVAIDNIRVRQDMEADLAMRSFSSPIDVSSGNPFTVSYALENVGSQAINGFDLEYYANGKLFATEYIDQSLESGAFARGTAKVILPVLAGYDTRFQARVMPSGATEGRADDNWSDVYAMRVQQSKLPPVSSLTGEVSSGGKVTLSWSEPPTSYENADPYTETFEKMPSWRNNIPGWTMIDVDGLPIGWCGVDLPGDAGYDSKLAWFVFDTADTSVANFPEDLFYTHSGDKFMSTMFCNGESTSLTQLDDWMITPELTGVAQTVSLWARSFSESYPETLHVLYSTSGKKINNFVVAGVYENLSEEWTEITVDVPEGTKYVAIRCYSNDRYMLFVDDVTYIPKETYEFKTTLQGYNLYRDGEKVNASPIVDRTFVDANACSDTHYYQVTVVYDLGESRPSPMWATDGSGIMLPATEAYTVKAGYGCIEIKGAENIKIFTVDGHLVYSGTPTTVSIAQGIYIVVADGHQTAKVAVQ